MEPFLFSRHIAAPDYVYRLTCGQPTLPPHVTHIDVGDDVDTYAVLRQNPQITHVWASGVDDEKFAALLGLGSLRWLVIHAVRMTRLDGIEQLTQLERLILWDAPQLTSLSGIESLSALNFLAMENIVRIRNLEPLAALHNLITLEIASPVGWDASGKRLEVASFAPIARLSRLRFLGLPGVRPLADGLRPLEQLTHLEQLRLPLDYPVEDYGRLAAAMPHLESALTRPFYELSGPFSTCNRCGSQKVVLIGKRSKRSRQQVCPQCNRMLVAEHVSRFVAAKASFTHPE